MEEIRLEQGDQVPDGAGDFVRVQGAQALLQRVLFRLSAKRGAFPFLPRLGSQLHRLARESAGDRQALCEQYVRQALEDEDVTVTEVVYSSQGETGQAAVYLEWQGEPLEVTVPLERRIQSLEER